MSQTSYTVDQAVGLAGMLADNGFHDILSKISNSRKIVSVAVTAADSQTFTLTINGTDFVVTTATAGATADSIAAALVALVNASSLDVTAANTTSPFTVTGSADNPDFTIDGSATGSGDLVETVTQAASQVTPYGS